MLSKEDVRAAVASIVGEKNMLTGQEDLTCYTYNAGGAAPSPHIPILAAFPSTAEEVSRIVGFCNGNSISIVPRSQGSGLSVNAIPESDNSIILSMAVAVSVEMPLMSVMEALISPVAVDCCSEAVAIART